MDDLYFLPFIQFWSVYVTSVWQCSGMSWAGLGLFSIPIRVLVTKNCLPLFCSRSRISRRHGKNLILRKEEQGYEYFFRKIQRFVCEKSSGKLLLPQGWLTGDNRLSVLNVAVLLQEVQLRAGFLIRWL